MGIVVKRFQEIKIYIGMLLERVCTLKAKINGRACDLRIFKQKNQEKILLVKDVALNSTSQVDVLRHGAFFTFSEDNEGVTVEVTEKNLAAVNRFETLIRQVTNYDSDDDDDADTEAYLSDTCSEISNFSFTSNITTASTRRRMSNTSVSSTRRPLSMISERELTEYGTF